ncbi:MAG: hypothetical protein FWH29_10905 [Methanobrevibacter sp.]|nr:hypothetical protein [Methanobrevibacter sp.]
MISSVSSADYYVNEGTTYKNITDWMINDAKTGNNLIFNTSSYNLTDQLIINKSINIKSYKNTHINFIQEEDMWCMFEINAKNSFTYEGKNTVLISGLTLNHYGNGDTVDYSGGKFGTTISGSHNARVDIKNTIVNTNLINGSSIEIREGNILNSTFNSKSYGVLAFYWKGNIINSRINAKGNGLSSYYNRGYWNGNMINTTIISGKSGVEVIVWKGKITNSTIHSKGSKSDGISIKYTEGSIYRSKIISKNGYAVKISEVAKITKSSLSSGKGLSKTYKYLPDLKIDSAFIYGRTAYISISNIGYSSSKPCQIGLKIGKTLKKAHVKSIKPFHLNFNLKNTITVKIILPKKLVNDKLKTVKVDYYNKNKELNKKNNVFKFIL